MAQWYRRTLTQLETTGSNPSVCNPYRVLSLSRLDPLLSSRLLSLSSRVSREESEREREKEREIGGDREEDTERGGAEEERWRGGGGGGGGRG